MNVHLDNISSTAEPFVPKLVLLCNIIVMQEDWFAVFKVKVTVKAHIIKHSSSHHVY